MTDICHFEYAYTYLGTGLGTDITILNERIINFRFLQ